MVHIITMVTSIAHIDIGGYKTPVCTLKPPPLSRVGSFLYPKSNHCIAVPQKILENPKKVSDDPKKRFLIVQCTAGT